MEGEGPRRGGAVIVARRAHPIQIAFTAWPSLMAVPAFRNVIPRGDLLGAVLPLAIVGVALIVLAPAKVRVAGS